MFEGLPKDKYNIKYELAQIEAVQLVCDRPIPRETLEVKKELERRLYWILVVDEELLGECYDQ